MKSVLLAQGTPLSEEHILPSQTHQKPPAPGHCAGGISFAPLLYSISVPVSSCVTLTLTRMRGRGRELRVRRHVHGHTASAPQRGDWTPARAASTRVSVTRLVPGPLSPPPCLLLVPTAPSPTIHARPGANLGVHEAGCTPGPRVRGHLCPFPKRLTSSDHSCSSLGWKPKEHSVSEPTVASPSPRPTSREGAAPRRATQEGMAQAGRSLRLTPGFSLTSRVSRERGPHSPKW